MREDPLQTATAIVVLSGCFPARALEASRLYNKGYAEEIWLTHPSSLRTDALKDLGIQFATENDLDRLVLLRNGVPSRAVHLLDTPISNTADELEAIGAALNDRGGRSVIIVTSKAHTRRVQLLWRKYEAARGQAIVHGVQEDTFDAAHWWQTAGDTEQVLHEIMGIVNAWAGLPVPSPVRIRRAATPSGADPD